MRVALICPSNILYMPFVDNYLKILELNNVDYQIISWDRFGTEKEDEYIYRDTKVGHQRSLLDYYKYSKFLFKILKKNNYDKIIVFSLQLLLFLGRYLTKHYKGKYIVDVRDYNKVITFLNIKNAILYSNLVVLSSSGYKSWLPKSNKYIINHNTQIENINQLLEVKNDWIIQDKLYVGCIGALRDYRVNIDLIKSLKNNKLIHLNYHGEGIINKNISNYLKVNSIKNVTLTGRYRKYEEVNLYNKNNLINVMRYNDDINNRTALPNRLYNAALYGKPLLAFEGTYMSEIIKKYNLGIVINSFENIEVELLKYMNNFDLETYEKGRKLFLNRAIIENKEFYDKIKMFIDL